MAKPAPNLLAPDPEVGVLKPLLLGLERREFGCSGGGPVMLGMVRGKGGREGEEEIFRALDGCVVEGQESMR